MRSALPLPLLALLFLASACSGAGPEPAAQAPPPRVAEQREDPAPRTRTGRVRLAQTFVLPGRRPWEIQAALASLREAGATVVALRAFHLPGDRYHGMAEEGAPRTGVYFRSEGSPLVADLLPVFVAAAHEEGLEAWAWMTTLDSRWLLEAIPEATAWSADPLSGRITPARRLDPFHPSTTRALEKLYRDLGRTGVDGILFQDDLVMRHTEGFSERARQAWAEASGRSAEPALFYREVVPRADGRARVGRYTAAFEAWTAWRTQSLLDLAEGLVEQAREGADGPVAACLNVYYDELWTPEGARNWLARDLKASLARDFDRYVVMAYHRQIGEETGRAGSGLQEALATMAGRLAEAAGDPARMVVKLQTVDWGTGEAIPMEEIEAAARPWLDAAPFSVGLAPASPLRPVSFPGQRPASAESRK
jgi:hypothetical protein